MLALLAAAATGAGVAIGAGVDDEEQRGAGSAAVAPPAESRAAAERLTPLQRAGHLVVLRFKGTRPPGYVLRALRERRVAGVILFADNIVSASQLRAMTRRLQRAARGRALVMTDQEGGPVKRIPWLGPPAQRTTRTASAARAGALDAGRGLRALGVNVALAPVADATRPGTALADRGWGGDPSALTAASVRGFAAAGIAATAKHFPGLGAARQNTDFAAATITGLGAQDIRPFRAALGAGVPLVMSSHALYPQLDPSRIASQSPEVLAGLLRRQLRFRGVIVTDSLEAKAVVRRTSTPVAALRSIAAGADLALTTSRQSYRPVLDAIASRARRSATFRKRVRESAARVLALQEQLRTASSRSR
jgi:beta-N-acetylhexosaminidase